MKRLKSICMGLLVLSLLLITNSRAVFAAEEEYTYTVRLYAGNQGVLKSGGIDVKSGSAVVSSKEDCVEIRGLKYGDMVSIRPQEAADMTDERYYVRGVRRSGRDNAEAESPAFYVASDRDYVVAYGIKGDMAEYTVNYQDEAGNALMKSDTYYGNIGERQYVSSRYIEGYQPRSLNMVKTLSANAAENVFTFQYVRITAGETETPGAVGATPSDAATTTTTTTTTDAAATTTDGGNAAPGADDGAADDGADAGDGGAEDAEEDDAGEALPGGDVSLPDDEVPLEQQDLENLDDGEVPLANIKEEQGMVMGYMPVYIGIAGTAAAVLGVAAVYLNKRRKKLAAASADKTENRSRDHKE